MLPLRLIRKFIPLCFLTFCLCIMTLSARAETVSVIEDITIDRLQLVTQQINLLKNRSHQSERELTELQQLHDKEISQLSDEKVSKNMLEKAGLDITVSKSNLDSINIELTDCLQTMSWLEKNVQEIENQLNVLSVFGSKFASNLAANRGELRTDLTYQKKLLGLEKTRADYLQKLQGVAGNILALRKDNYAQLSALLKSRTLLHIKQVTVNDEIVFQEQQNHWQQEVNTNYAKLAKIDPLKSRFDYAQMERAIFVANEHANLAYVNSLLARYKDQIQQMKLAVLRSNSISLLNEMSDQVQTLNKQLNRLNGVLKSRTSVMANHISYLSKRKKHAEELKVYIKKLADLEVQYKTVDKALGGLTRNLFEFRSTLEHELQIELSSRQGFPTFSVKTFLDLGKEMLLVPALTFQMMKSLSTNLIKAFSSLSTFAWSMIALAETLLLFSAFLLRKFILRILNKPSWRDQITSKWLVLQWLRGNIVDLFFIGNLTAMMYFFKIPPQNYKFMVYLSIVWLFFNCVNLIARLCLVESTHDTSGQDMKLYRLLRWMILIGGIITALTVFVHQLPLIYELKTLCDRLFLLLLMMLSLLLLRSAHVIPNLILIHMEQDHLYLQRSARLIGILVPILMFCNSIIGLFGFVNLIMTVSRYEGLFLIVLIAYLFLRGLLSDGMEQLSRLMIAYINNGWLWTEAFLKPLDKVLRITMFLTAWAVLFLLYGWDKQSPVVDRLTRLLQYQLMNVLGTTITPLSILELFVVISVFYWTARWTREFVYRLLASRTKDMGIRNSIAILSQYSVVVLGMFISMRVLGIDLRALAVVFGMFAFGIGLGLRDLANNFACGFLILLERPLRVGDIVNINNIEGEVTHIGGRAVSVKTWDHMDLVVPNTEIFNKSFTNWTAKDNTVRSVVHIKISRHDNPHEVKAIIQNVLANHKDVLKDPVPEVYLKEMSDTLMDFELRYFVNIRQVKSRTYVMSAVLMSIWEAFATHGIKPPYPQQEIVLRREMPPMGLVENIAVVSGEK